MQADLEEKPLLEDERNETPLEAQRVPQGQPETRQESETLNTFRAALGYLLSTPDTPPLKRMLCLGVKIFLVFFQTSVLTGVIWATISPTCSAASSSGMSRGHLVLNG